jgi:acyl carrier protein
VNRDVRTIVLDALRRIAPDVDPESVDPVRDLRESLDLDSMDFLRFVTALHERLGVDVPESDYPKITTLAGLLEYFSDRGSAMRRG